MSQPLHALKISEIFESIQGEGVSQGLPAVFLRLALCNLRCHFCDTKYTWDFERYDYAKEVQVWGLPEVAQRLLQSGIQRLIITGGEPLVQHKALDALLPLLEFPAIEVETNGTIAPSALLFERVTQWNVSPKLSSAGDPESDRYNPEVLLLLRDTGHAWLKFVIGSAHDADEASALAAHLNWPKDRVFFMPQAQTRSELAARASDVAAQALAARVRFSNRLHVQLWDSKRGR